MRGVEVIARWCRLLCLVILGVFLARPLLASEGLEFALADPFYATGRSNNHFTDMRIMCSRRAGCRRP